MPAFLSALFLVACLFAAPVAATAAPKASDLVQAELVAEPDTLAPGQRFTLGIRMRVREHWHVYWRNPGDSGLAPEAKWTLPAGFSVGGFQWPTPSRIPVAHLVNYGYEGETTLLVEMTAPETLAPGATVPIKADLSYLVCERECIPGEASLATTLRGAPAGAAGKPDTSVRHIFDAARAALPLPAPWGSRLTPDADTLVLSVAAPGLKREAICGAYYFVNDDAAIEHAAPQPFSVEPDGITLRLKRSAFAKGPPPADLPGTLVLEEDLGGTLSRQAFRFGSETGPAGAVVTGPPAPDLSLATILNAALLAFLGGVVLNLMPCVFPVLSIKVLSLVRYSGKSPGYVRASGLAYTAGVVASFLGLAALLLAVRAGGAEIGWGFQLQSPGFVAALVFLLFALGLSLSGVLELGTSLAGMAGRLDRGSGLSGSFLTGILATIVATPCTAPFMGAAVGYALTVPAAAALAVFAALGLGLAAPFLVLTAVPRLLARLPKPGPWMETLKQVLAFPVYATVAWLVFVLAQQVGPSALFAVLLGLVLVGFAAWTLRITATATGWGRGAGRAVALVSLAGLLAIGWTLEAGRADGGRPVATAALDPAAAGSSPQPFSQGRLDALRAEGRVVFVNMTAAWCITCLVNEKTALSSAAVREAFGRRDVVYLKGDWTNQNPEITRLLERHGRSGVPLYVLYPGSGEAIVLPQILTEGIVLEHLGRLGEAITKRADLAPINNPEVKR